MTDHNFTPNNQSDSVTTEVPEATAVPKSKPGVQWVTFIWGLLFTAMSSVMLWALLSGYSNFWTVFFIFDGSQWLITFTVVLGGFILLLGLTALARRKN